PSSRRTCSSTTWSARMRGATSSADTARPVSAGRVSGTGRATTASTSVWRGRSTRRSQPIPSATDETRQTGMQSLALFFLVAVAIGGVAWVFLYPVLSGERQAEQRRASVAQTEPQTARVARGTQRARREQVEDTLREMELRRKK